MLYLTGALTSKPYAFNSRPWELRSVQSIDILDGIGSNISIDFKETEIVRILPRKNPEINENWISDKVRFFYDGLKRQRLTSPYYKVMGELAPARWQNTLRKVSSALKVFAFEYGPSKVGVLADSSLETEALYAVKVFSSHFGFSLLGVNSNSNLCIDDSFTYKFRSRIVDLENIDYCLLVGTNPRLEASMLNLRLQKLYRKGLMSVSSVGGSFHSNFPIDFLGLTANGLVAIAEGRHVVCKSLVKVKRPVVLLSFKLFERFDSKGVQCVLKTLVNCYLFASDKHVNIDILHSCSNLVGAFDLGLNSYKKDDLSRVKFLYLINVSNVDFFSLKRYNWINNFVLFQNFIGNQHTNMGDVVLPSTSFSEIAGVYYNTEGRPQRTQSVFDGPNLSRDNWKILRLLYFFLDKNSTYDTKAQLNSQLAKVLPSFYFADFWFSVESLSSLKNLFITENYPELILFSPFKLFIEDFFMTHSFCRASKVMAKASESLRSVATNYNFLSSLKF